MGILFALIVSVTLTRAQSHKTLEQHWLYHSKHFHRHFNFLVPVVNETNIVLIDIEPNNFLKFVYN